MAASCNEDYKDWADPQSSSEGDASAVAGSVTPVGSIAESADNVTVLNLSTSEGNTMAVSQLFVNGQSVGFSVENGSVMVDGNVLKDIVRNTYKSMAPVARDLEVSGKFAMKNDKGEAFPVNVEPMTVSYSPAALPANAKESAYYYVGGFNNWDLSNPTPFVDKGDGIFELTITIGDSEWFAFAPQSAVDNQDWNALFRAPSNGCTDTFGFLDNDPSTGWSFQCEKGGKYTFSLDMVNYTWSYAPYVGALWYAGDANGWNFWRLAEVGDGQFTGYYYINAVDNENTWGFKFPTADNWDKPQYGAGEGDWSIALGGGNITLPENKEGFYQINVDTKSLTYSVTEVTSISIIGTVNGSWDNDTDLTYDPSQKCWTWQGELQAGMFKFRMNHDWTISWGGSSEDPNALTSANGKDIELVEGGQYIVKFWPNCDGYGVYSIQDATKYYGDLWYAGDANGWSFQPMAQTGDGEYTAYYFINAVDNENTWGFKFPTSNDWDHPQFGAGTGDWSIEMGGGNITLPDNKDGFYQIVVKVNERTYSVNEVNSISIIGTVNGSWDVDTDLTFDVAEKCWTWTGALKAGMFKFRMNHDWTISWGSSEDPNYLTSANGKDIELAADGNYTIKFWPNCDGQGVYTIQ